MDEKDNRNYIADKIHPIFEKLVVDLLVSKPEEPIDFIISWMQTKGSQFRLSALPASFTPTSLKELNQ